jgi:hypothetical protein
LGLLLFLFGTSCKSSTTPFAWPATLEHHTMMVTFLAVSSNLSCCYSTNNNGLKSSFVGVIIAEGKRTYTQSIVSSGNRDVRH